MRVKLGILLAAVFVLVGFSVRLILAAETQSPWALSVAPTLEKLVSLPDNSLPPGNNIDCQKITTRMTGSGAMIEDCVVGSPYGLTGNQGIVFTGTSESIPVKVSSPFVGLSSVPNQPLYYTYTSSSITGMYLHFYRGLQNKLRGPELVNGQAQYTVNQPPDLTLRDSAGKSLVVNTATLAFSANGNWMVVDLPYKGFVRVNMATFEMQPFETSLNRGNDYSSRNAQVTISNDGRHVAVKPHDYSYFKVYDLAGCASTALPVEPDKLPCSSRDYWPFLSERMSGLQAVYQPRFINGTQLSFNAAHDYVSANNFRVSQMILTAPGESPAGIEYLGMGDSFAAGQGAFNYLEGTDTNNNTCHLSSLSYPLLASNSLFASGHSVACSGAKTRDILDLSLYYEGQVKDRLKKFQRDDFDIASYLAAFTPGYLSQTEFIEHHKPQAITISIGGNDIGFAEIVKTCAHPRSEDGSCYPNYEDQMELYNSIHQVFDKLVSTYTLIKKPGKRVYAVGYPQVASTDGNCANNVRLDAREIELSISLVNYLNSVIQQAAKKAGVYYVHVPEALAGHKMCERDSSQVAVNGFTVGNDDGLSNFKFVGSESYHPNALGHQLLDQAVRSATSNLTAPMPEPSPTLVSPAPPDLRLNTLLPQSGRQLRVTIPDEAMTEDVVVSGQSAALKVSQSAVLLKPGSSFRVELHSTPVELGNLVTDAGGYLNGSVMLPAGVPAGFHTLHLFGQNFIGQPVDIYKVVYLAASSDDYNGDGVLNADDPCAFVAASGQDLDKDGVDDACDPVIADTTGSTERHFSVRLTGNKIVVTSSQ